MKGIAYISSFTACKSLRIIKGSSFRQMLKFHENINIIFCGGKPSQKTKLSLMKILLALMKKA